MGLERGPQAATASISDRVRAGFAIIVKTVRTRVTRKATPAPTLLASTIAAVIKIVAVTGRTRTRTRTRLAHQTCDKHAQLFPSV